MGEIFGQIRDNLRFFSICVVIAAGVILLAKLAEHFLLKHRQVSVARRVSIIGMCSAIAMVLYMLDFPVPFLAPPFYKLDFSEIPVLLCGFFLGPSAGVICLALKVLLKLLLPLHLLLGLLFHGFFGDEKAVKDPVKPQLLFPGFGIHRPKGGFYLLPVRHSKGDQQPGGILRLLGADW